MSWLSQLNQRRDWIVRALILGATLTWANVPRPYVILGPTQTVPTHHPITCVHTRLTDEVEPWKVLRSLEMVRAMGAPTIVEYFPWAYYEGQKDSFGWGHADIDRKSTRLYSSHIPLSRM